MNPISPLGIFEVTGPNRKAHPHSDQTGGERSLSARGEPYYQEYSIGAPERENMAIEKLNTQKHKITPEEAARELEEDITRLSMIVGYARCIMNDIVEDYLPPSKPDTALLIGGYRNYSQKACIVMEYLSEAYDTIKRLYELDGSELE